jgi:AraC-like DNA-binding protein
VAASLAHLETRVAARTRVLRSAPDEPPWELWQRDPHPALAGLVAGLWVGRSAGAHARHRLLPNGELMLMLHLGPGQRLRERGGEACDDPLREGFVSGLQERPSTYYCAEPHSCVATVRLLPLGGYAIFGGLPQAELAGQVLELEAVLGGRSGIAELRERMLDARDGGAMLDLLEAWLLLRFGVAREPHAATREVSTLLGGSAGSLRIDALAHTAGVSQRRLHELFVREVGVPAKRLARILRFRRALDGLATAPAIDLARLAQHCGYYDQSHLNRDFRDLAIMTPLDYLVAHGAGLDGPDVIGG